MKGRSYYMRKILSKEGGPGQTIEILKKYGFVFQKRFGQNFLIDPHVLDKIMGAAHIQPDDLVLEIGPGIGTLTQHLACAARKVIAVEIDRSLIPILEDTLGDFDNTEIIHSDILKVDLETLIQEQNQGKPVKVVANLPYYITTPILMDLLEKRIPVTSLTVMVQKEVAKRMCVGPGSKEYGALSLAVQYYARPSIAAHVPSNCFLPRPKVGSTVVQLDVYDVLPVRPADERLMFQIIRASFNQRRKTLVNGLKNAPGLSLEKDEIHDALDRCGFSADIRGEDLSLGQFAELSDMFTKK